jgi:putative membrane protein
MRKRKIVIIVFFLCCFSLTIIKPLYAREMFLQHSATLLALLFMVWDIKYPKLSVSSFFMLALFMIFHAVGARWLYSMVPYELWFEFVFSWNPHDFFAWERNHYDRFVHFAFGFLLFFSFFDLFKNSRNISKRTAVLLAFLSIQTASMVYELFEWGLTFWLSPEDAENYNGQQGDMWDAQKDMALALLGSLISTVYVLMRKPK